MSEPLIVPSTPAEWESEPEASEPRCDVCRKHADDLGHQWCAYCGCCRQHCQEFVGCNDEPSALECDDCGVEDGARWDIGPNNQWSVCDGCKDSYGYN